MGVNRAFLAMRSSLGSKETIMGLLIHTFLSLLSLTSIATTLDLYVSSDGTSNGPISGSSSQNTYSGLEQAQNAVRSIIAKGMTEDITIWIADGTYYLDSPLNLTVADSGRNGHTVTWKAIGSNAIISGGLKVTGWKQNGTSGIYQASVPKGTQSRNLYVNGWAAQYARAKLNRTDFKGTNYTYYWNTSEYDWLMTTTGIAGAELRSLESFTDHYAPIWAVGNQSLIMAQDTWKNQIVGWDTFLAPYADFGLWVQNALALLDDGGEYYLDSENGVVYYMPLEGEDMETAETYLGLLEAIVVICGSSYDDPAHDIAFKGINFAHSTWLRPGAYGYADQQTGGYIGQNVTYPTFEAAREYWYQNPGAIQISASYNIAFTGGTYTQLGAGGFGIGNDPNAHVSGLGLGAKNISVSKGYFTQVMGNSIYAGGINIPAHHPNSSSMINSGIHATENIFYNTSTLFSSTVAIMYTYVQYSSIVNNDISHTPYSGICLGYGWGMNDVGGSPLYVSFGTYNYQPIFETPTTLMNNVIHGNLIHDYGYSHTDLGSIYTLSKSPSTYITQNYAFNSSWYGVYTDEGSNGYIILNNSFVSQGGEGFGWYNPDQNPSLNTENLTLINNFGLWKPGWDYTDAPNHTGYYNSTFLRNFVVGSLLQTKPEGQRVAYRAGIPPARRAGRPVSNPDIPDAYLGLEFPSIPNGQLVATLWNFDDEDFRVKSFSASASNGMARPLHLPSSVPADNVSTATWQLVETAGCSLPFVSVEATYTNLRTGKTQTITANGTATGFLPLNSTWSNSSTWPASFGQSCESLAIRTGGRNTNGTYDDWAVIYKPSAVASNGSVTAKVLSVDDVVPGSMAGVAVRDSFINLTPSDDSKHVNATGYAAVYVTAAEGVIFAFDEGGNGYLTNSTNLTALAPPLWVRVSITGTSVSGYYSADGNSWSQIGSMVKIPRNRTVSDGAVIANSRASFEYGTAIFDEVSFS